MNAFDFGALGLPSKGTQEQAVEMYNQDAFARSFDLGLGSQMPKPEKAPEPELVGEEARMAAKHPNLMAARYWVASMAGETGKWWASETYRHQRSDPAIEDQALHMAVGGFMDALVFVPGVGAAAAKGISRIIGSGWRVIGKPTGLYQKFRFPFSKLTAKDVPLEIPSAVDSLLLRYGGKGLKKSEAQAIIDGPRGLVRMFGETEKKLGRAYAGKKFAPDDILFQHSPAMRDLVSWGPGLTPRPTAEALSATTWAGRYQEAWKLAVRRNPVLNKFYSTNNLSGLFKTEARRLFGRRGAERFTLGNASPNVIRNMIRDMDANAGKIAWLGDTSFMSYVRPIRKTLDYFEDAYGTYSKGYVPITSAFERASQMEADDIMRFHNIQVEHGLGKIKKGFGGRPDRIKPFYSASEAKLAGELVHKIRDMTQKLNLQGTSAVQKRTEIEKLVSRYPTNSQKLAKAYHEWTDYMYKNNLYTKMEGAFRTVGLTDAGREVAAKEFRYFQNIVNAIMDPKHNIYESEKRRLLMGAMNKIRKEMVESSGAKNFYYTDPAIGRGLMERELTFTRTTATGKRFGNVTNYLENYAAKMPTEHDAAYISFVEQLFNIKRAGYTIPRSAQEAFVMAEKDLGTMVEARASIQARELVVRPFLNPEGELAGYLRGLPDGLKEYFTHYVSRMLGRPSYSDMKIANFISNKFGQKLSGSSVDKVAQEVNNLFFMGVLGAKPFSAMRNLFQPLVTGPGELGGIRGVHDLWKGLMMMKKPEWRDYLFNSGIIKEFAPELFAKMRAMPAGIGIKMGGKERWLPEMDNVRDALLIMFEMSDIFSRMWMASSAAINWSRVIKKYMKPTALGDKVMDANGIRKFMKEPGLSSRGFGKRNEIKALLETHQYEDAMKLYMRDVTADTQFLYGKADAPLAIHKYGAPAKMGAVFQSWTVNYAELLHSWATTGNIPQHMTGWLASSAAAYMVMSGLWGTERAAESTFLGPITDPNMPIVLHPVFESMKAIYHLGTMRPNLAEKDMKKLLSTVRNVIPAGSALSQFKRGFEKGPAEGLASLGGFQRGWIYQSMNK